MVFGSLFVFFVVLVARLRRHRRADRVRVRHRHHVLPDDHHRYAAVGGGQPDGRRHVEPAAAVGADVRLPRPADGDDRHRRVMVNFLVALVGPCARRPVLRAAGRDVSGLRHFRIESRRHGGGGAGAVSGNAPARAASGRTGVAAGDLQRDVGDDPAVAGADHHRVGDQCLDLGAVHRRPAAGAGGGDRAGGGGVVAVAQGGYRRAAGGRRAA